MIGKLFLTSLMLTVPHPAGATTKTAQATFAELSTLVGDWTTDPEKGRALQVSFTLTAANTVLVERWKTASGRESLTLYYIDGQRIVVTHYCPIGNQPRLVMDRVAQSGRLSFSFLDATGLDSKGESHLTKLWLQPDGSRLLRGETYVENGKAENSLLTLLRVASPTP